MPGLPTVDLNLFFICFVQHLRLQNLAESSYPHLTFQRTRLPTLHFFRNSEQEVEGDFSASLRRSSDAEQIHCLFAAPPAYSFGGKQDACGFWKPSRSTRLRRCCFEFVGKSLLESSWQPSWADGRDAEGFDARGAFLSCLFSVKFTHNPEQARKSDFLRWEQLPYITFQHFSTLGVGRWLNDEIINYFIQKWCSEAGTTLGLNTFFACKILFQQNDCRNAKSGRLSPEDESQAVRWCQKTQVRTSDLSSSLPIADFIPGKTQSQFVGRRFYSNTWEFLSLVFCLHWFHSKAYRDLWQSPGNLRSQSTKAPSSAQKYESYASELNWRNFWKDRNSPFIHSDPHVVDRSTGTDERCSGPFEQ